MSFSYSTKTELMLQALRQRIRSGELGAGTPLRVDALSKEFGISSTPVREALRLLQADGLVNYEPHRGARVAAATDRLNRLEDIYAIRCVLEPLATQVTTAALTDETLEDLRNLHEAYAEKANDPTTSDADLSERNSAWHLGVYAGAPSIYGELIWRLWQGQPWQATVSMQGRRAAALTEHSEVMERIEARDPEGAADAMRRHLAAAIDAYLAGLRADSAEAQDAATDAS